jgi:hypothetical protein
MDFRPGGIARKTGNPYTPFYSCQSCGQTVDASNGPKESTIKTSPAKLEPTVRQSPDWDEIAVGKVASNFIQAMIASGYDPGKIQHGHVEDCFMLARQVVYFGKGV